MDCNFINLWMKALACWNVHDSDSCVRVFALRCHTTILLRKEFATQKYRHICKSDLGWSISLLIRDPWYWIYLLVLWLQFSVQIKGNETHRFKIIWYIIEVIETRVFYFALNFHLLTAAQVTSFHVNFLTMWKKHKKIRLVFIILWFKIN